MKIGVLALQGDFEAHSQRLAELDAEPVEMRYASQLREVQGLILPVARARPTSFCSSGRGLWDDCSNSPARSRSWALAAGAILLASRVSNPPQPSLAAVDMLIERNAYGRQVDSSIRTIEPEPEFAERTASGSLEAVFIRAPIIRSVGPQVRPLLRDGDEPILVEQGLHLAATFHPEAHGRHAPSQAVPRQGALDLKRLPARAKLVRYLRMPL